MEDMEIDEELTPAYAYYASRKRPHNTGLEDDPTLSTSFVLDNIGPENKLIPSMSQAMNNLRKEDKSVPASSEAVEILRIEDEPIPSTLQAVDNLRKEHEIIPSTSQAVRYLRTEDKPKCFMSQLVGSLRTQDNPISSKFQAVGIQEIEVQHTPTLQANDNLIIENKPTLSSTHVTYNLGPEYESEPASSSSALCNLAIENQSTPLSQDICKNPLDGWSKDEKYLLYFGIKYKSSKRVKEIQESLPNKTVEQIEAAIAHYKARANKNPECSLRKLKVRKVKTKPLIPLATWAKVLTDNLSYNELQTECANAVRLIADLEEMPTPESTEMIDFQKVYHQIADAIEGKALSDDRLVSEVLNSCLLDAALVSKPFIKATAFKHVINSVNFREKELPFFPRPTQDNELAIIRHFCVLRNYNPLGIVEENLTHSVNVSLAKQ